MIPSNQTINFQNLWLGFNFSFIDMIFMVGNKHLLIGKNMIVGHFHHLCGHKGSSLKQKS
jgi:hypothetical protein